MMFTRSVVLGSRLARSYDRAYRLPMSAWLRAHAGLGVDGAAPDLTPAGDGEMVPRPAGRVITLNGRVGAIRKWCHAVDVHVRAFEDSRLRSLLHLATSGRLVVSGGAICSLGRVPSTRAGRLSLMVLVVLVATPALAVSIAPGTLSLTGRLLWLTLTTILTVVAMVASARRFTVARRWGRDRSDGVEVTNLGSARSGHGDAGRLLDAVIDHADRRRDQLLLRVRRSNEVALHLYHSRGFTALPNHESASEICMERSTPSGRALPRFTLHDISVLAVPILAVTALLATDRTAFLVVPTAGALIALAYAALIDRRSGRLPNALLASATAFGVVACDAADMGAAAILGATVAATPLLIMHLAEPSALGFGDVKFAASAGVVVAAQNWPSAVGVPLVALLIAAVRRFADGRRPRPLGPALLVGAAVAVVAASFVLVTEAVT